MSYRLDLTERLFIPLIKTFYLWRASRKKDLCEICKGEVVTTSSTLYLLPVYFGETHPETVEYYKSVVVPIESETQIPNGQRACYFHVLCCQNCGKKEVAVVDFLKVRDKEILKGGRVFPYSEFQDFLS